MLSHLGVTLIHRTYSQPASSQRFVPSQPAPSCCRTHFQSASPRRRSHIRTTHSPRRCTRTRTSCSLRRCTPFQSALSERCTSWLAFLDLDDLISVAVEDFSPAENTDLYATVSLGKDNRTCVLVCEP